MKPVLQELLNVGGVHYREAGGEVGVVALEGEGGALAHGVVASQYYGRAIGSGAVEVGVLQGISGAVDSWPFAIPDARYPVEFGAGEHMGHLAAVDGCDGYVLIDSGHMNNVVLFEELLDAGQLKVVSSHGRTFIAGDEGPSAQARPAVPPGLVDGQPDQGLHTR